MGQGTDGTPSLPNAFIVRLLGPDGAVAGVGTLVGERLIVTCAHVVNAALGLDVVHQERPEDAVRVDFPLVAPGMAALTATVVAWAPPPKPGAAGDDVAGLLLAQDPPAGAAAAKLGVEPARAGQALQVFGYPRQPPRPDGVFVPVTVRGRVGNGKLQLDSAPESAHRVQPGFSGSPVFDEVLGRVAGMVVEAPPAAATARDSLAIDAERLRLAWPEAMGARWQRGAGARRGQARAELTILHVSDTQFGKYHLFGGNGLTRADREEDSLFTRLHTDLSGLAEQEGLRPDLIVVTGDLAEWGLRSEFGQVVRFLAALAEAAEVPRRHVAVVPGNHDVNRKASAAYFAERDSLELAPVAPYFPKWRDFAAAFGEFYAGVPGATFTPDEPWTLFEMPDLRVVVAGLNSTMADSHRDYDHYGWTGEHQLRQFARRLRDYRSRGWLRLAAVHHNVVRGAVLDDENLRDADDLDQILGTGQLVNLLLHGHTHDAKLRYLSSGLPALSTGSAAVAQEARPAEVPNQYQLITVRRDGFTRYARQYSPGQRRWIGDTRVSASGSDWRERRGYQLTDVDAVFAAAVPAADVLGGGTRQDSDGGTGTRTGYKGAARITPLDDSFREGAAWGLPPVDSFLQRVAEATVARFPDVAISVGSRGGCEYLRVFHRLDVATAEVRPVGVVDGPATEAGLAAFAEHVHAQFAAADPQVRSELVYAGPAAPAQLVSAARRQGIRLRSFVDYQGLLDLGPLARRQQERLAADPVYPEQLYVEQRYRMADDAEVRTGLIERAVEWLSSDDARLIVVLGDFGRGKTSFLRQLTRALPRELPAVAPILVELRTLEKAPTLDELLGQHLIKQGVEDINPAKLRYMIRSGRIALLFDGFDELELRVGYDNAADYLRTLLDSVTERAKVILTSRTQRFRSTQQVKTALGARVETRSASRMVVLEDFTEDQILRFLANLYDGDQARAKARFALLSGIENLLALAHNPRMLAFVAAMDDEQLAQVRHREGRLTQAGLYREIIDFWLAREAERQEHHGGLKSFDRDERLKACTVLALRLWTSGTPTIALSELSADVSAALTGLAERGYSGEQATHSIASGSLLVRTEDGAFRFIHQSIMEWLVAAAAAEDNEGKVLAKRQMSRLIADFYIDLANPAAVMDRSGALLGSAEATETAKQNALLIWERLSAAGLLTLEHYAKADLRGSDLTSTDLNGADLRNADLRNASLSGVRLTSTNLSRADLRGADLTGVRMTGGSLRRAILGGSVWHRAAILGTDEAADATAPELRAAAIAGRDPAEAVVRPSFAPAEVAFSPDGALLAVCSSNVVEIVDAIDGSILRILSGHRSEVHSVAFSPDGTVIATASADGTARTWDTATGTPRTTLTGHAFGVTSVAFSPDGTLIATASADRTARTWDTATGTPHTTLTGHKNVVNAVAFSPDGTLIATASADSTARTWDTATGTPRTTLTGHDSIVRAVTFSPDGTLIATASGDGTTRVWDTATGAHLATLVALPDGGYATLLADGHYKLAGDPTDRVWWAIKLCRFEAGELDPYVAEIKRLPPDAPIL